MLLLIIILLTLIDLFLGYEFPTHIAYILLTLFIVNGIDTGFLFQIFFAILIWFALVVFHYTIWRKVIEKIHDTLISRRKHIGGIENCIGKRGVINEVGGVPFIFIGEELYEFENKTKKEIIVGETYKILNIKSNKLLI